MQSPVAMSYVLQLVIKAQHQGLAVRTFIGAVQSVQVVTVASQSVQSALKDVQDKQESPLAATT